MNQAILFLLLAAAVSAEVSCPADEVVYYSHEYDCSQYYLCIYGQSIKIECPKGLEYDSNRKICDSPERAQCTFKSQKPTCPPGETVLIPHETYCSKFYSCDNGMRIEMDCANGTEFYPEIQQCDWPHQDGSCWASSTSVEPPTSGRPTDSTTGRPTEAPSTTERPTQAPTTTERPTQAPTTTERPTQAPTTTERPTQAPTTTARPTEAPTTTERPTQAPTTTERPTQAPTTTERPTQAPTTTERPTQAPTTTSVPITSTQIPDTTTPQAPENVCPNKTGIVLVPHPENCSSFYVCYSGQGTLFECDAGFEFSPEKQDCVVISENGCTASQTATTTLAPEVTTTPRPICPSTTTITLEPHETNCSMFYICVSGDPLLFECDPDLEFSPEAQGCVEISSNGCTASQSGSNNKIEICANNQGISLLPDHDDCSIFHICSNTDLTTLSCDADYEFDKENLVCVPIAQGGCTSNKKLRSSRQSALKSLLKSFSSA